MSGDIDRFLFIDDDSGEFFNDESTGTEVVSVCETKYINDIVLGF